MELDIVTTWPKGQWKLYLHIPPEGCIILPEGHRRPQVEAAQRQDNAPLRWNNVAFWQYNFHCPLGQVVIISHFVMLFGATVLRDGTGY